MGAAYQEERIQEAILILSSAYQELSSNPVRKSTISERHSEKATFPFSLMSMIGRFCLTPFGKK